MQGHTCSHREAIRDIARPDDETSTPTIKPGVKTSEFWATVVTVVGNLLAALVVIGLVNGDDAEALSSAISASITAIGVLVTNGLVVWKYIQGRFLAKQEQVRLQMQAQQHRHSYRVEMMKLQLQAPPVAVSPPDATVVPTEIYRKG